MTAECIQNKNAPKAKLQNAPEICAKYETHPLLPETEATLMFV